MNEELDRLMEIDSYKRARGEGGISNSQFEAAETEHNRRAAESARTYVAPASPKPQKSEEE